MPNSRDVLTDRGRKWADERGQKTAYSFLRDGELVEESITFSELDMRARGLAAIMQRTLEPASRALLLFPSGIDFVVAFVACMYAGVVAVPVNNPKPKQQHWQRLASIVHDAGVSVILTNADNLAKNSGWLQDSDIFGLLPRIAVDSAALDDADLWTDPGIDRDSIAFLQYTSGSTGTPKGVMVSHGNLMHNSELIRGAFGHNADTVLVTWLPLFHDLGLIGNVLQTLYLGASCYLMTPVAFLQQPSRWLRAISMFRGTTSMAPNFAYERCLDTTDEQKSGLDLSSWTCALNGAEPLRIDTVEAFERVFASCGFRPETSFPAYGLAEGTLIVATAEKFGTVQSVIADSAAFRAGRFVRRDAHVEPETMRLISSGRARSDLQLAIVDPESAERLVDGMIGELWVKGDSVCKGYWNKPEDSERVFRARLADGGGPYMRTGDMAFMIGLDLYITGRLKEVVIIRGQNYYPQDIEYAIQRAHPVLREDCGAAFSIEADGNERLVLVQEVERTAIRALDVPAICAQIRRAVAEAAEIQVHAIVLIKPATLPKTSSGKIQRTLCQRHFQEGLIFDGEIARDVSTMADIVHQDVSARLPADADVDQVHALIVARLARHLRVSVGRLDDVATFSDLGLDSSVAVGFAAEVGRWIGRQQDSSLLWIHPNIGSLCEHVMSELAIERHSREFVAAT